MKRMYVLLALLFVNVGLFAARYLPSKLLMLDGSVLEGLATMPVNPGPSPIYFKEDKAAKRRLVVSTDIKTILYFSDKGDTLLEYDSKSIYLYGSQKKPTPVLLRVIKRGHVTLYEYVSLTVNPGAVTNNSRNVFTKYWLCNEPEIASPTIIANDKDRDKRGVFVHNAAEYFKDDADLANKIRSGAFKWTDMSQIVEEYNRFLLTRN